MNRIKRPCLAPACGALVERGYCPAHQPLAERQQRLYELQRGSSSQRGYGSRWRAFRAWFLSQPENALCQDCGRNPPTDVHHLRKLRGHPELQYEVSNCRALCHGCHAARTIKGQ